MIEPLWVFYGLVLPASICAAVVFLTGWLFRSHPWVAAGPGWALGVGAGFVAGYHAVDGWPPLPPTESQHWLVLVALPAMVLVSCLGPYPHTPLFARVSIRLFQFLLAAALAPLLLQSYLKYDWSGGQATMWITNLGTSAIVLWLMTDLLKEWRPGRWVVAALSLVAGGTGVVILMSGSQSLGQMGLSLAGVLAAGWAVSWVLPNGAVTPATVGVALTLLVGLWLNGYYYASVTATNAVLLAVSPLAAWLVELLPLRKSPDWRVGVLRVVAIGIPVGVALALAAIRFQKAMSQPSYY